MKFDDMQFSLTFVQWLLMAVLAGYTWFTRQQNANNADVAALNAELVKIRERVVALEIEMKNLPSEATVRELIGQLSALAAHNQGTKQQLEALQQSVSRINDFLLNQR